MTLEIIERQTQQAGVDVQVQLGIEPGSDGQHDQPSGMAEQSFIEYRDRQDNGQQSQGGITMMGQHPVHRGHHQQRRKNSQETERQGGEANVA